MLWGPPRFLEDPPYPHALLSDPGGTPMLLAKRIEMLPSAKITASAPTTRSLSGLYHTAYGLPVYASQYELPHPYATLGFSCRHA
jgi:hypothetical protein